MYDVREKLKKERFNNGGNQYVVCSVCTVDESGVRNV
jgi:hypothetical protein